MIWTNKHPVLLSILASGLALSSCGKKPTSAAAGGARDGVVESALRGAAHEHGIPVRFLMAVAYLESRLSGKRATAHYLSTNGEGAPLTRGTLMTQNAFGLPHDVLGLDPADEASQTLAVQINAYARYVAGKIKDQGLALAPSPANDEQKYYWIENLANIQRSGTSGSGERRNIRVIFAHELISILNDGFIWQDPDHNGEKVELTPESPKLDVQHFPANGQQWMSLSLSPADIRKPYYAYMNLTNLPNPSNLINHPRRVEVVHCPLSLSACLELQNGSADNDDYVHLAAHYIVPESHHDDEEIERLQAIQVATHDDVVILTDKLGEHQPVNDAIVVMLTGGSGRIVDGRRDPALPTWFDDRQLRNAGQVINDICSRLAQQDPEHVSLDQCLSTSGDSGVQFRYQNKAEEYRWGDIADFDATIFNAYIASPDGLNTKVAFNFPSNRKRYTKDEKIPLRLNFNATVKSISIERLVRCGNGQVTWEVLVNQPNRAGETKYAFDDNRSDSGPNNNGEQFYRARIFGSDGALLGWNIDRVVLSSYEKTPILAPSATCGAG